MTRKGPKTKDNSHLQSTTTHTVVQRPTIFGVTRSMSRSRPKSLAQKLGRARFSASRATLAFVIASQTALVSSYPTHAPSRPPTALLEKRCASQLC